MQGPGHFYVQIRGYNIVNYNILQINLRVGLGLKPDSTNLCASVVQKFMTYA